MAANFAQIWQNFAFAEDSEYAKSAVYTNILSILTNTKRYSFQATYARSLPRTNACYDVIPIQLQNCAVEWEQ